MIKTISHSPAETEALGERLARTLCPGDVVAFTGGLGAGKTAFTRGMARTLSPEAEVSSPTFALVNDYGGAVPFWHFDMYRIKTADDLYSTGFFDYLDAGGILAVEWSENITGALPAGTVFVQITPLGENEREIVIRRGDESGEGEDAH